MSYYRHILASNTFIGIFLAFSSSWGKLGDHNLLHWIRYFRLLFCLIPDTLLEKDKNQLNKPQKTQMTKDDKYYLVQFLAVFANKSLFCWVNITIIQSEKTSSYLQIIVSEGISYWMIIHSYILKMKIVC